MHQAKFETENTANNQLALQRFSTDVNQTAVAPTSGQKRAKASQYLEDAAKFD